MIVEGRNVWSRLLSPRAARLMGLPEKYALPNNYDEAYHVAGDGGVPVAMAGDLQETLKVFTSFEQIVW
jgi:hypothetical protein